MVFGGWLGGGGSQTFLPYIWGGGVENFFPKELGGSSNVLPTTWKCNQPPHLVINDSSLRTQAFFMWTAKTLIRLGGCPGWSESSLGAHAILLVLSWGGSIMIILNDFNNDILSSNRNKKLERIMLKFDLHHTFKDRIFWNTPRSDND